MPLNIHSQFWVTVSDERRMENIELLESQKDILAKLQNVDSRNLYTAGEHTLRSIDSRSLSSADVAKVFAVEKPMLQPQALNIGETQKGKPCKS